MTRGLQRGSAAALRSELSDRNRLRSETISAEISYSAVPSVVYQEDVRREHGNFLAASYKRILQQDDWKARLSKVYTGSRFLPRSSDRVRRELECANSSDALLMNIFCYPGVTSRTTVSSLLGFPLGFRPTFGYKPGIPLKNGRNDRSEVDLKLGSLLIEAKLTEGNFQTARAAMVYRYRDFEEVFDLERLCARNEHIRGCQLIRGALAAYVHDATFVVLCDDRRQDLVEDCFTVLSAIRHAELRCRMRVLSWQELAPALPAKLRTFLADKYGIVPAPIA